jgi:uncharacterized membrane protein (UPF0127 family)
MRRAPLVLACLLLLAGCAGPNAGPAPASTDVGSSTAPAATPVSTPGSGYETTTVTLVDEDGAPLATVDVWVADTWMKRYTGLSDTSSLRAGQGMLFVHDREATHSYVMRDMDFPLDIVFVAADGRITAIHHAPVHTGSGDLPQYSGRGKYVLEVPMGYTNETGVEVGDRVRIGAD